MKVSSLSVGSKVKFLAIYVALVVFYCALYAPFGLENNDGGFILGLAHQFSEGARIYEDIAYVRPPASIVLHAVSFIPPFDVAPVFSSRVIYFMQVGVYSASAALLFSHMLKFSSAGSLILASTCFILNAHNFPPMAWHTVDGVFFSVLALHFAAIYNPRKALAIFGRSFVAFALALLAALSKQPFYITPLLVAIVLLYPFSVWKGFFAILGAFFGALLLCFTLVSLFNVGAMLEAITAQTNFRDLLTAGVLNFARDWYNFRIMTTAGPLSAVLFCWALLKKEKENLFAPKSLSLALVLAIIVYIASILHVFLTTDRWVSPKAMFDSIFSITALISIVETFRARDSIWLILTALHGIAWAASISWGYTTTALFSNPSVIVITICCVDLFHKVNIPKAIAAVFPITFAAVFFVGNQFLYSLEGPAKRSDAVVILGAKFPALNGIWGSASQANALRELQEFSARFGRNVVVLPNWPLYNVIFGNVNPIGVDWPLNAEVEPFDLLVRSRLETVEFALVFRNANPSPWGEGRFGSRVTQSVMRTWVLEDADMQYFQVYKNPLPRRLSFGLH